MSSQEQLDSLKDIRNMMERSSKFLSLSGLTGIFIGIYALVGATAAYLYIESHTLQDDIYNPGLHSSRHLGLDFYIFAFTVALIVLGASLLTGVITTMRKAKKNGVKVWDSTAKRLVINLGIPLVTGGIFCLLLLYHMYIGFVAPSMLIFYGLALINASKYTFNDIRFLGLCEIALGLLAMYFIGAGLLFWALGFGVLHIIYGISMYYKYDR